MKTRLFLLTVLLAAFSAPGFSSQKEKREYETAVQNGLLANEAFVRSMNFVKGWMQHRDRSEEHTSELQSQR